LQYFKGLGLVPDLHPQMAQERDMEVVAGTEGQPWQQVRRMEIIKTLVSLGVVVDWAPMLGKEVECCRWK